MRIALIIALLVAAGAALAPTGPAGANACNPQVQKC